MLSVSYGARDAILECQGQFKFERWNCTTKQTYNDSVYDFFGSTLRLGISDFKKFICADI